MDRIQNKDHRKGTYEINKILLYEILKKSFHCLVCMTRYMQKKMDMMDQLVVIRVNCKKKLFCQAYCFNFQSNQDSFHVKLVFRLLAWHIKFEKHRALKEKISELMSLAWYPKRWWNICMSEDETKEIKLIFTE